MKITKADFATIRAAVGPLPAACTERERWDALWRAVDSGKLSYSVLEPYADAHIDTALRAIAASITFTFPR